MLELVIVGLLIGLFIGFLVFSGKRSTLPQITGGTNGQTHQSVQKYSQYK